MRFYIISFFWEVETHYAVATLDRGIVAAFKVYRP
jgi:hypothetical protein